MLIYKQELFNPFVADGSEIIERLFAFITNLIMR